MAHVLVMRRKVSHNELPTKARCCSVSNDAGDRWARQRTVHCNAAQCYLLFILLSCHQRHRLRARAGKLGRQKSGPKTYGGENDSGRLQVHLTAAEAVKQTRYVNGPNCKEGERCKGKKERKDDQNQEPERKGTGPASIIFFLIVSCVCADLRCEKRDEIRPGKNGGGPCRPYFLGPGPVLKCRG